MRSGCAGSVDITAESGIELCCMSRHSMWFQGVITVRNVKNYVLLEMR